jgi:hypothetical protein
MRLVIKKADNISDMKKILAKHVDIVIIENVPDAAYPELKFLNFDFNMAGGGFHRRKWVYHPSFHSGGRTKAFRCIYDYVSGGGILLQKVHSGKSSNLSLVTEMISALDSFSCTPEVKQLHLNPESIYLYLRPETADIPLVVGSLEDSTGMRLPYLKKGRQFAWTRRWNPVCDIINPNLLDWIKEQDRPAYEDFTEHSRSSNTDMFDSAIASKAFNDERVLVLDESRMWPVAFALKFGNGAVAVLPDNADIKAMLSEMEDSATKKTGFELIKAYAESLSGRIEVKLEGLPLSATGTLRHSDKISYTVVIDGKETLVTTTALCLFKFLIVWLASKLGIGIAFTTPLNLEVIKKSTGRSNLKLAMLAASENELKPLPGGELFHHVASNISTDIADVVSSAIYGMRDIGKEEWIRIYHQDKHREMPKVKGYSARKIHGIRINSSAQFISQLRKFTFDVSAKKKNPREDCLEFNKRRKVFIKPFVDNIRSLAVHS